MRIILSKDGIVREIHTPFAMCCGMEELDELISELQCMRRYMDNCTSGWFKVDISHPSDGPPNTPPPKGWTE